MLVFFFLSTQYIWEGRGKVLFLTQSTALSSIVFSSEKAYSKMSTKLKETMGV